MDAGHPAIVVLSGVALVACGLWLRRGGGDDRDGHLSISLALMARLWWFVAGLGAWASLVGVARWTGLVG